MLPEAQALGEGLGTPLHTCYLVPGEPGLTGLHFHGQELQTEVDSISDIWTDLGPNPEGRVLKSSEPLHLLAVWPWASHLTFRAPVASPEKGWNSSTPPQGVRRMEGPGR